MPEVTFLSNTMRKERINYLSVIIIAVITWILQVSIFNRILYFDTAPNFMLLGSIFLGLTEGIFVGSIFGIICSLFSASIFYDHSFYFSYPICGAVAGFLTKKLFSDELLFFILLTFILVFPFELLNGWQFSLKNPINIFARYTIVSFNGATLNLIISPIFYYIMNFVTKKLKMRQ